jgi:hypothetical protein
MIITLHVHVVNDKNAWSLASVPLYIFMESCMAVYAREVLSSNIGPDTVHPD